MATSKDLQDLRAQLRDHIAQLHVIHSDVQAYLSGLQERHDQLTLRVDRLDRQVDGLTNPETARGRKLMDDLDRLSSVHAQSEEHLDDLENLVLEPIREARDTLARLVS